MPLLSVTRDLSQTTKTYLSADSNKRVRRQWKAVITWQVCWCDDITLWSRSQLAVGALVTCNNLQWKICFDFWVDESDIKRRVTHPWHSTWHKSGRHMPSSVWPAINCNRVHWRAISPSPSKKKELCFSYAPASFTTCARILFLGRGNIQSSTVYRVYFVVKSK